MFGFGMKEAAKMTRAEVIAALKHWLDTYGPYSREDGDGTEEDIFAELVAAAPADVAARAKAARARKEAGFPAERARHEAEERAEYLRRMATPHRRRRLPR